MRGRYRSAGLAAALLLGGCADVAAPAHAQTREPADPVIRDTFASGHGTRDYRLYVPAGVAVPAEGAVRPVEPDDRSDARPPLVVLLHGCTQTADDFAFATRGDAAGAAAGALVLYPEQPSTAQPQRCWTWYEPGHQARGSGEAALLAEMIEAIVSEYGADRDRVYVAGISAGGAMAQVLAAAYPDLVRAQAVHSAVPYRSATELMGALTVVQDGAPRPDSLVDYVLDAMGERARPVPTLIIHGAEDAAVRPINAEQIEAQWAGVARRLGTGAPPVRRITVPALAHAWSGGSPDALFTDPSTMDATSEIFGFFLRDAR